MVWKCHSSRESWRWPLPILRCSILRIALCGSNGLVNENTSSTSFSQPSSKGGILKTWGGEIEAKNMKINKINAIEKSKSPDRTLKAYKICGRVCAFVCHRPLLQLQLGPEILWIHFWWNTKATWAHPLHFVALLVFYSRVPLEAGPIKFSMLCFWESKLTLSDRHICVCGWLWPCIQCVKQCLKDYISITFSLERQGTGLFSSSRGGCSVTSTESLVLAELQLNTLAISSSPVTPFPLYGVEGSLTWLLNLAAGPAHGKRVELRSYIENPESFFRAQPPFCCFGAWKAVQKALSLLCDH